MNDKQASAAKAIEDILDQLILSALQWWGAHRMGLISEDESKQRVSMTKRKIAEEIAVRMYPSA